MTKVPLTRVFVTDEFKRFARTLEKRYRNLRADLQPLIEQLQNGEFPGDQISGTSYTVYKVRVKNSTIRKGKSGGYRVIYQSLSVEAVVLLYLYSKSDQDNVAATDLLSIIERFQIPPEPNEQE
jgi:mRNA-degrading endonuclease RelE of RelBE toxin-antitoxin system